MSISSRCRVESARLLQHWRFFSRALGVGYDTPYWLIRDRKASRQLKTQHVSDICRRIGGLWKGCCLCASPMVELRIVGTRAPNVASEAVEAGLYMSFKGTARHS